MNIRIFLSILFVVVLISIVITIVLNLPADTEIQEDYNQMRENKTSEFLPIIEQEQPSGQNLEKEESNKIKPEQNSTVLTIDIDGNTQDGRFLTVSGVIPSEPYHITGTITSGIGIDIRIVQVFQIQVDDENNTFSHKIGINDNYLWEEDTVYTISVKHGKLTKNIEFYRGTSENNFEDSIIPIIK